jgi:hypothetical protein
MEANNNFKKIMEEEEILFTAPSLVEKKVVSNISFLDFFGRTIELFVPKIVELFVVMTGGTLEQLKAVELPSLLTEEGESDGDYNAAAPGDAGSDIPGDK